jgi:hypothetical protein
MAGAGASPPRRHQLLSFRSLAGLARLLRRRLLGGRCLAGLRRLLHRFLCRLLLCYCHQCIPPIGLAESSILVTSTRCSARIRVSDTCRCGRGVNRCIVHALPFIRLNAGFDRIIGSDRVRSVSDSRSNFPIVLIRIRHHGTMHNNFCASPPTSIPPRDHGRGHRKKPRREFEGAGNLHERAQLHPLVAPQVSHLRQVPFLTKVKLPHS